MRTYEMVLVFDPALEVEQIESDLQKMNDFVAQHGTPRRWERWGKRRLAYELKGRQYGYYAVTVFDLDNARTADLDRSARLNTSLVRHLITVVDPERVPEVDEESIRNLGAGAAPADVDAVKAEENAAAAGEATESAVPVDTGTEKPAGPA